MTAVFHEPSSEPKTFFKWTRSVNTLCWRVLVKFETVHKRTPPSVCVPEPEINVRNKGNEKQERKVPMIQSFDAIWGLSKRVSELLSFAKNSVVCAPCCNMTMLYQDLNVPFEFESEKNWSGPFLWND